MHLQQLIVLFAVLLVGTVLAFQLQWAYWKKEALLRTLGRQTLDVVIQKEWYGILLTLDGRSYRIPRWQISKPSDECPVDFPAGKQTIIATRLATYQKTTDRIFLYGSRGDADHIATID